MRAWLLAGVVLVGVAEGSSQEWLTRIRSNDDQDSVSYGSVHPPIQHSKTHTRIAGRSSQESESQLQDLDYRPDEGLDEDLSRRTSRSVMGSYGYTTTDSKQHVFSILSLIVFASFLSFLIYHLVSNYREEKKKDDERALHDEVLTDLLRSVLVGVGKWSLLQYLSDGVEDFDVLRLWN